MCCDGTAYRFSVKITSCMGPLVREAGLIAGTLFPGKHGDAKDERIRSPGA